LGARERGGWRYLVRDRGGSSRCSAARRLRGRSWRGRSRARGYGASDCHRGQPEVQARVGAFLEAACRNWLELRLQSLWYDLSWLL